MGREGSGGGGSRQALSESIAKPHVNAIAGKLGASGVLAGIRKNMRSSLALRFHLGALPQDGRRAGTRVTSVHD